MKGSKGFSFIEMLTVIAIVGILAVIAIPSWLMCAKGRRLKSAGESARVMIRQASAEASRQKVLYQAMFRERNNRVEVGALEADEATLNNLPASLDAIEWKLLPEGIAIDTTSNYLFPLDTTHNFYWIRFKEDGSIADGVNLAANDRITLTTTEDLNNTNRKKICEVVLTTLGSMGAFENGKCNEQLGS